MPNWISLNAAIRLRTSVTALAFVTMIAANLSGQSAMPVQRTQAASKEPFAEIDRSLAGTADALIASSKAPPVENVRATAGPAVTPRADPQMLPLRVAGLGSAGARVELLRPHVEPILESHSVPAGLAAAVMFVESGGRTDALSAKGARGLWQLMPDTARRYGLRVDEIRDDRLDLFSATDAAARYLHDLYVEFGDWKLALAAYNTGEGNVASAILRAHTQDFDQLATLQMLPLETRNYVPRVLATARSVSPISILGEASHGAASATTVFAVSNP